MSVGWNYLLSGLLWQAGLPIGLKTKGKRKLLCRGEPLLVAFRRGDGPGVPPATLGAVGPQWRKPGGAGHPLLGLLGQA